MPACYRNYNSHRVCYVTHVCVSSNLRISSAPRRFFVTGELCTYLHTYINCYRADSDQHQINYKNVISVIMEPLSFVAHLAVLPLLFLQFLSTYAWICLVGDKYCGDDVASNQLQIDRSGILIGFFISAAVIGITSRMTSATK